MLAQSTIPPALPKKIGKTTTTITTASAQQQENDGSDGKASLLQKKYREPEQSGPVNIMHDKRIHRGNTYSYPSLPLNAQPDPVEIQKENDIKRRSKAKRRSDLQRRIQTPDAVQGRKHIEIQTELYLEELSDKIPEALASTQTDAFLDRAPSPLYVPQKSGVDVATQILDGELFCFDYEVTTILEVLVGKTIEQSLMEVVEESELDLLKQHQEAHEKRRNAEHVEVQRLEDAERRRSEEKERRLAESLRILKDKQETSEKIAARAFAHTYLANLVPNMLEDLTNVGYFLDVVRKDVETEFLPWLSRGVAQNLEKSRLAKLVVDDLIRNAIATRRNAVPAS